MKVFDVIYSKHNLRELQYSFLWKPYAARHGHAAGD
jgi:hypothetical protein